MFEEMKNKKAWEKFKIFSINNRAGCSERNVDDYVASFWFESLSGWLFRFFDEQGIYITTHVNVPGKGLPVIFECWVGWKGGPRIYCENFNSRQEAGLTTFKKAFEILEKRLTLKK